MLVYTYMYMYMYMQMYMSMYMCTLLCPCICIYVSITKLPNDAWRACPRLDARANSTGLGALAGSLDRPDSPRLASNRSTGPLRAAKVDRKGRPSVPETRFSTILGRFWKDFRRFSRLLRAIGATRSAKGRTSVFASRRSTFKGSQTSQKNRKSTKISEKSLRRCFANV